ncbi:hypothetical protein [Pseudarthrobacter naphthalenicus]|uniref:hypothetical protein n=1 Tax=Pseudarthrobacter naphthalenicus TaxID=3031328 RepID=UPI003AF12157
MFVGDAVATVTGTLTRAPSAFTADADEAELSLRKLSELHPARMLFAHGPGILDPVSQLLELLATNGEGIVATLCAGASRCRRRGTRSAQRVGGPSGQRCRPLRWPVLPARDDVQGIPVGGGRAPTAASCRRRCSQAPSAFSAVPARPLLAVGPPPCGTR